MTIPEATMNNLKDWLEETISWLYQDGSTTTLQRPHKQLIDLMVKAKDEKHTGRVWDLIDEMEKLILRMPDTREQGEAYIYCAKMAADMENIKDALRLFIAAESKYKSYPHQRAVALWMAGCIHWMTHQQVDAIAAWQETILLLRERYLSIQIDPAKFKWYGEKIPELEQYLEYGIGQEQLPLYGKEPDQVDPATDPKPDPAPVSVPDPQPDPEDTDSIRWLSCFISDSVPAGGFAPTGFDPNPVGYLEFSEVLIENEAYEIHSAKTKSIRRNIVNIASPTEYQTVRVTGTSMNAARPVPINEGDYVLVHRQNNPNDNEIVIAAIFEQDTLATVKRLKYRSGKIQLIPESTDRHHYENPDWEKEWSRNEISIVGVIEAVFKKK